MYCTLSRTFISSTVAHIRLRVLPESNLHHSQTSTQHCTHQTAAHTSAAPHHMPLLPSYASDCTTHTSASAHIRLRIVTLKHLQHKQSASQQTACQAAAHTSAQLSYMPYLPSHAPPSMHHTQAMQPDLKSVCACRKAANSSHRSCSPTCTASGIR